MSVKTLSEEHGIEMFVLALALLIVVVLFFFGCGTSSKSSPPPPPPPVTDTAFEAVRPLVEQKCGPCHNGTVHPLKFDTGAKFKASKAKARITADTMPPTNKLDSDSKQKLLAYLNS